MRDGLEFLTKDRGTPWLEKLESEFDDFRRRFVVVVLGLGILAHCAVGLESIHLGEWLNVAIVGAMIAVLATGLVSALARRSRIDRIAATILAAYPPLYFVSVLSPWSHGVHLVFLMALPPLMDALSKPEQRNGWFVYGAAFVVAAGLLPILGVPNAWTRYYNPGRIVTVHAAFVAVGAMSWVVGSQRARHFERMILDVLFDHSSRLPSIVSFREDARRSGRAAVFIVAIRNFSELSSMFGYGLAEDILRLTARRLESAADALGGRAYRLHGRDFGVLLPVPASGQTSDRNPFDRQRMAEELLSRLGGPIDWQGRAIELTHAIGHACLSDGDAELALSEADSALKRLGPEASGAVGFETLHDVRTTAEASIASLITLSRNVAERSFAVSYQAIVELASGRPAWHEALLRVQEEGGVYALPSRYLRIASSTGHWAAISDFVLEAASAVAGRGPIALNVGFRDFERQPFVDAAIAAARQARASGSAIIFEILESDMGLADDRFESILGRLRAAGALVAIDDFGSGYSNYRRLLTCPADIVKIDGSLSSIVTQDRAARTMIAGLVGVCDELGIATVAEFVETEAQASALRDSGVRFGQGFLWSRPCAFAETTPPTPGLLPIRSTCA